MTVFGMSANDNIFIWMFVSWYVLLLLFVSFRFLFSLHFTYHITIQFHFIGFDVAACARVHTQHTQNTNTLTFTRAHIHIYIYSFRKWSSSLNYEINWPISNLKFITRSIYSDVLKSFSPFNCLAFAFSSSSLFIKRIFNLALELNWDIFFIRGTGENNNNHNSSRSSNNSNDDCDVCVFDCVMHIAKWIGDRMWRYISCDKICVWDLLSITWKRS